MKKFILALMCAALSFGTNAQSSVGVDTTFYTNNDTLYFNSLDSIKVYFINYGPQAYTGLVWAEYAVDTTFLPGPYTTLSSDSFNVSNWQPMTLLPDSAVFSVDARFRSGINTVVIWPRSTNPNLITNDSLKLQVFVVSPAGIENPDVHLPATIFPNPGRQILYISSPHPGFVIERVRIWTAGGKLRQELPFSGKLDITALAPGVYFVEFVDGRGQTSRTKLIKE